MGQLSGPIAYENLHSLSTPKSVEISDVERLSCICGDPHHVSTGSTVERERTPQLVYLKKKFMALVSNLKNNY